MPTAAELRESVDQATTRLLALTSRSMQQVRGLASRGIHQVQAFSDSCRGRKREANDQQWSTSSTSERNSQNQDSSKNFWE